MNRARALAAVLVSIGAWWPTTAPAQNLEAGKSPGQLFSNNCNACHRSPRGLLRSVPPGSLPGFLREHYTTSRDMAQQLSGFLISNGATDTRGRPQEVRQQPAGAELPRPPRPGEPEPQARPPRPSEPEQQARPPRSVEQERAARPLEPQQAAPPNPTEARMSRRERRAKRDAERQRQAQETTPPAAAATPTSGRDADRRKNRRITPARIEAASARGKDALPLGSVMKTDPPAADPARPEAAVQQSASERAKPPAESSSTEPATRSDPVPQVTPAPSSASSAEAPREMPAEAPHGSDDPPSGSTAPEPPAPPVTGAMPPAPPISN